MPRRNDKAIRDSAHRNPLHHRLQHGSDLSAPRGRAHARAPLELADGDLLAGVQRDLAGAGEAGARGAVQLTHLDVARGGDVGAGGLGRGDGVEGAVEGVSALGEEGVAVVH